MLYSDENCSVGEQLVITFYTILAGIEMSDKEFSHKEIENYILETNAGIIPREMYISRKVDGIDPFHGFSEAEVRKMKRKFRKLKRLAFSKYTRSFCKYYSAESIWTQIDKLLRQKEKI